jgi:nucleotide-binding universal stress UspA family protein
MSLDLILCLVPVDAESTALACSKRIALASRAEVVLARFCVRAGLDPLADGRLAGDELGVATGPARLGPHVMADLGRIVVDLGVSMVIVPEELAAVAVSLAESLRRPVLVARESRGDHVVIATDVAAPGDPVLDAGVRLATRLAAPIVAIHNIPPTVASNQPVRGADARGEEVRRSTQRYGIARTVIAHEPSTPHAIFDLARTEAAEVIVVGVRQRSWLRRQLGTGVPERIARDARCSVLVTPICHAMA